MLPEAFRKRPVRGIVIAKGPLVSKDIDIADDVITNAYSGEKISMEDGGIFWIVQEEDIHAVMTDSDVVLIDTETMKRLIQERRTEFCVKEDELAVSIIVTEFAEDLLDRIDSLTRAEGFEF